jgi:glutamine amidotransferase
VSAAGGTGRFNFLLTDGRSLAATACGDTLWYRQAEGEPAGPAARGTEPADSLARPPAAAVVVASEPFDDEPGWREVPDRHVLATTARGVRVQPLAAAAPAPHSPAPAGLPTVARG